jgi:hypothetical protein
MSFMTQFFFIKGIAFAIGNPHKERHYPTRSKGRIMGSFEDIQQQSAEQTLKEEVQLLRKENEDLAQQVRALMARLEGSQQYPQPPAFSPLEPASTSSQTPNQAQAQVPVAQQETNENRAPPIALQTPPVNTPVILNIPPPPVAAAIPPPTTDKQTVEQMEYILKRLRMLEGNQGVADPAQFCIVTDLEVPKDFKVPDFEKYDGITGEIDPNVHIQMYCNRMGAYLKNEKMMLYLLPGKTSQVNS